MKPEASSEIRSEMTAVDLDRVMQEVARAVRNVSFGSVEIVIHNSRVVQIERKEKFRFDQLRPA